MPAKPRQGPTPLQAPEGLNGWRVLDSLGESVAVVDRGYRVVWLKEPLLGGRAVGRIIGQPCHLAFFGQERPCQTACPVGPVFALGRPQVVERRFSDPDGRPRWREARAYPVFDGQGRVSLAVRISFDITSRKQDEARRRRDQDLLEQALGQVGRLQLGELPFQPSREDPLSPRELEVLRLAAGGLSNPRIALLLGISPNTVKRHMAHVFDKLMVNDRAQAAVWAARRGLI